MFAADTILAAFKGKKITSVVEEGISPLCVASPLSESEQTPEIKFVPTDNVQNSSEFWRGARRVTVPAGSQRARSIVARNNGGGF